MGRKLLLGVLILSTILWSNAYGEAGERRRYTNSIPGNEEITCLNYYRQTDGDDWLVATTSNANTYSLQADFYCLGLHHREV